MGLMLAQMTYNVLRQSIAQILHVVCVKADHIRNASNVATKATPSPAAGRVVPVRHGYFHQA